MGVGLKVSRGRLPLPWHVNELLNTSMVEGVFARRLDDVALALDAATARPAPPGKFFGVPPARTPSRARATLGEEPRLLRVGFTTDAFGRAGACELERAARVREVARRLAADGHAVEELAAGELPDFLTLWRAFETFWVGMRTASWQLVHGASLPASKLAALSPMVRGYWHASARYDKGDVMSYLASNVRIQLAFGRLLERYDVLLLPVVPYATPAANGALSPALEQPFDDFVQAFLDAGRYTIPANEAGFPALAVPAGLDSHGMPLAVQLYGRWHEEEALLQAGHAVERLLEPVTARASVHVCSVI